MPALARSSSVKQGAWTMISEVFWSSVIGYEFRRVTLPFSSEPSENNPDWSPLPSGIGTRLSVLLRAFSRVDRGRLFLWY